ncbi:MAG: hypothetical protein LBO03_07170 [Acidaminococcales bacterium]|jgi:hypothetical protein|nr:hypothetical protein [Acidaminococcales bacterium]
MEQNAALKEISDLSGMQRAALFPLWGRPFSAGFVRKSPTIKRLSSSSVLWAITSGKLKKAFGEYGGLAYIVRGRKIDDAIGRFIARKSGGKDAIMCFYINNPQIFDLWSPLLR